MEFYLLLFSQARPDGAASRAYLLGVAQRHLLSQQDRLPVAQSARALRSLAHRLSLLPALEKQRIVGSDSHPSAGTGPLAGGAQTPRQRRDPRQPERQEHRMQRRTRLRRRQENQGAQTTHFGRYDRPALAGDGVAGAHSGSRWSQAVARGLLCLSAAPSRQTYLGRWQLRRRAAGVEPSM